ncbi:MAG: HEAT repeat domain-containing protein [Tepidisphaeraceae bacterium]|jgi:HEAT repeat protein
MARKPASKNTPKRYTTAQAPAKPVVAVKKEISPQTKTTVPATAAAPVAVAQAPATPAPVAAAPKPQTASLIAELRNSDADAARDAATALGALGDTSAVQPLIDVLVNADGYFHAVVRAAAAASLGQLRDVRAVPALEVAVRDTIAEPSTEAIRALGAIGDARGVNALIQVIRNQDGFFLSVARLAATRALGSFASEQAASEVRSIASNPAEDAVIREAALEIVQKAGAKKSN